MRGPYPFQLLPKYPHLSKGEADIWSRFVATNPGYFDRVWYDVEIGSLRENHEDLTPEIARNRRYLGKYKIDVLGEKNGRLYIVEVKREATTTALGEVWLYDELYKRDFKPQLPLGSLILTDTEMPDMREVCEKDGIQLLIA